MSKIQMNCSFQHAALAVADVDISVEYYMNVFGFKEIPNLTKRPEIRWLSLGEGLELHLIQSDTAEIKVTKYVAPCLEYVSFQRAD